MLPEPFGATGDVEQARALAEHALASTLAVVEWSGSQGVRNNDDRSRGMADVAYALDRLDLDADAEQAFAAALDAARQSGRQAVYYVIGRYAESTDEAERLTRISRTLVDVDSWLSYRPPGSPTAFVAAVGGCLAKRGG